VTHTTSAPARKPAIEVVTEEARAPVSESMQPESNQPESKQPPSGGGESTARYGLWAASVAAVLLIGWGGMKLLSNPESRTESDPLSDVSPVRLADGSASASGEAVSSETGDAAETPADAEAGRPASTAPVTRLASAEEAPGRSALAAPVVNEVIPDVPSSASRTIRGRVRVSVRVIVEQDGTVFAALADDRGPSRYFERVAIDAAKKWTFAPAETEEQRLMLIRFTFTRQGTTASATALR
jgi:TonB family protein